MTATVVFEDSDTSVESNQRFAAYTLIFFHYSTRNSHHSVFLQEDVYHDHFEHPLVYNLQTRQTELISWQEITMNITAV